MCIFCAQAGVQHHGSQAPAPPASGSIKDLRLSKAEYDRLSSSRSTSTSSDIANNLVKPDSPKVRVVGGTEDTKALLQEASGVNGQQWVEVPYSMMDSMLWIMQRLEKIVRVPMKNWTLAGDGIVYSGGHLVMSLNHFRKGGIIEVVMLPAWDVQSYVEANMKTHVWKHAPVAVTSPLPNDPRERATVLFGLIKPIESSHWSAYIARRQEAEKITNQLMDAMAGADMDPYLASLREIIGDVCEEAVIIAMGRIAQLQPGDWKKVADGISVLTCEAVDDGWGNASDVKVISRIHSPVSPASVDVRFFFHHRTRMHSVEWNYSMSFRVNTQPVACSDMTIESASRPATWRPFGWFYLDDRRSEHSICGITRAGLQAAHDALFGSKSAKDGEDETLGAGIGLRETALLMLASVGIKFNIAEDEDEAEDGENDGYLSSHGDALSLELKSEKPGLSAAHFRKICGIKPLGDDDMADLSVEQVTEPMDSDGEGEDSDEGDMDGCRPQ